MRGVVGTSWLLGALIGIVTLTSGCNGSSSSSGSSGCQAACNRCGSEICLDCAATSARLRDEFENAVFACVLQGSDASCDTLWTDCVVQGGGQLTPRPADTTYRDACLAKRSDCEAMGVTFADDNCLGSQILEEALVAQAMQCLSQSCANIVACLNPLFN
jgi:hypothetical protein